VLRHSICKASKNNAGLRNRIYEEASHVSGLQPMTPMRVSLVIKGNSNVPITVCHHDQLGLHQQKLIEIQTQVKDVMRSLSMHRFLVDAGTSHAIREWGAHTLNG